MLDAEHIAAEARLFLCSGGEKNIRVHLAASSKAKPGDTVLFPLHMPDDPTEWG